MGDNGPGYNESEVTMGLGISLIDILCDQLDANKTFTNTKEGVTYRIELDVFKDQSNK
jgi:two-component sensor histidine kinase